MRKPPQKPVLLGMNNPLSRDPHYALANFPERCTGWRLWRMIVEAMEHDGLAPMSRLDYMTRYDRRNVLNGVIWNMALAKEAGAELAPKLADRVVVLCGVQTLEAMRLTRPSDWCSWVEGEPQGSLLAAQDRSFKYALIPHPSGRCREYNDPALKLKVGRLLLDVLQDAEVG